MCPLWPAHILLTYLFLLGPLWFLSFGVIRTAAQVASTFQVSYNPAKVSQLKTDNSTPLQIFFNKTELLEEFNSLGIGEEEIVLEFVEGDAVVATISPSRVPLSESKLKTNSNSTSGLDEYLEVNITGHFLGYASICPVARMRSMNNSASAAEEDSSVITPNVTTHTMDSSKCLDITVIRESGTLDKVFTYSVATLVTILYVNMGAALDMQIIRETIKRPYGPVIGFMCQFVIMPVLAYGLAKLLIPKPGLQLGLFITGCSPAGGASNIWTLMLGGNLDLSITMTTISSFAAFAMMPFWILTLGSTIFAETDITIPYRNIAILAGALVIPLGIGIGIQFKYPKVAKFLVRILKPCAIFLIIFIVVFAIYTNVYLFKLFTWRILLAGMSLPWFGYVLGGGTAWLLKQSWRDVIAIGIETGVQNTGLAILALRFSLPQPEADLTIALPVAVAVMTPVIPSMIYIYQRIIQHKGISTEMNGNVPKREDSMTPTLTSST